MTLAAVLTSPDERQPRFLVEFQQGPNYWRYTTDDEADALAMGSTFSQLPITVSKLTRSATEATNDAQVTLPFDNPVVAIFDAFLPVEPVTCTVWMEEKQDLTLPQRMVMSGQVVSAVDDDSGMTTLNVKPIYDALNRGVPWQSQQVACPIVLFGIQCTVSADAFKTTADGGVILTNAYVQADVWNNADPIWFKAGYVRSRRTREIRFVLQQNAGGQLILSYPFSQARADDIFDAYAGCMRDGETCRTKFNNKSNFAGFEQIPYANIFKSGIK